MNKKERKELIEIVGEALEGVVIPQLQEIRDDMVVVKKDVSSIKDDIEDLYSITERIEKKLDAEIQRKDILSVKISQLDKRVIKLESHA